MSDWRFELLGLLEGSASHRVCSTAELAALVRAVRPRAASATVQKAIEGLVAAKALMKVGKGVYVNRLSWPPTELGEVTPLIRHGAVVSLHSVLGECGLLNNIPAIVTAALPLSAERAPNVGEVRTSGGQVFRFHALPERFFPTSPADARRLLQPTRFFPIARPEVALCHWFYLADSHRSKMLRPPRDVDLSVLDLDLLQTLVRKWQLEHPVMDWLSEVEWYGHKNGEH